MKKWFKRAAALAATAAVVVSASPASAMERQADRAPIVAHVQTVAAFDFTAGEAPENITVNPDNSLTISMLGSVAGMRPKLVRIGPGGHRTVLAVGQQGDTFTGNTRGADGTIYYNVASADAARAGVWKLPAGGSTRRIAALPTDGLPNGLAIDPTGRTLYIADSLKSTIWTVPASGGSPTAWLVDPALAPTPSVPFGANGLRFHNHAVWVSNLAQATLSQIPVTATGTPGRIRVITSDLAGVDDFNFLNDRSDVVFAAQNGPNQIAVVYPNGTTKAVLTGSDGLASPTATAVSGSRLYITDAGLAPPHDAKVQRGHINLAALLADAFGAQHSNP